MVLAAIERENPTGGQPAGLKNTAIERDSIVPQQPCTGNHNCHCVTPCPACLCKPMRTSKYDHLLKKPLQDHLKGLLNRLDLLSDERMAQPIIDSAMLILIEVARIDQIRRAAL